MIALGVDPGTRHLGWGVVVRAGNRLTHVDHGVIHLDPDDELAVRLKHIDERLSGVLAQHRPVVGSVESLFFHKDAQAAAKLGHARGVVLLALARAGVQVAEYAPARVKRTIAGNGRADKRQVALVIRAMLGLADVPPSDAADALALAVTHLRVGSGPAAQLVAARPRTRAQTALHAMLRGRKPAARGLTPELLASLKSRRA